jgi:hypothetical protein
MTTTRKEMLAAATRLRGVAMNPRLGLAEWYPPHTGSDSPAQDSQRAYYGDLLMVAEWVIEQAQPKCDACGWPNKADGCCSRRGCCNDE